MCCHEIFFHPFFLLIASLVKNSRSFLSSYLWDGIQLISVIPDFHDACSMRSTWTRVLLPIYKSNDIFNWNKANDNSILSSQFKCDLYVGSITASNTLIAKMTIFFRSVSTPYICTLISLRTLRELVKKFHNKMSQQERRSMGKNKKFAIMGTFKSYREGFWLLLWPIEKWNRPVLRNSIRFIAWEASSLIFPIEKNATIFWLSHFQ